MEVGQGPNWGRSAKEKKVVQKEPSLWPRFISCVASSYIGRRLATGRSPVQGVCKIHSSRRYTQLLSASLNKQQINEHNNILCRGLIRSYIGPTDRVEKVC
jgi:hypothetical protein